MSVSHSSKKHLPAYPDMAICKAENIGLRGYADCLVEPHPYTCEYAVPFGSGILCRHPQRDVIIENTLNAPNGDANANE